MSKALATLKNYVTQKDGHEYDLLADGLVSVTVTHNYLTAKMISIRLDLHTTIANVKLKLYTHCGTLPADQCLVLKSDGAVVCEMDNDSRPLGFYGVKSGMEIKVVDTNPHSLAKNGGLEDVSLVKKYRMSDEDYDKRKGTMREYKREMLKKDPNFKFKVQTTSQVNPHAKAEIATEEDRAPK